MKRNECTVEKLKALGYVAKSRFVNGWRFDSESIKECNAKQSTELFNIVVDVVRNGGNVDIRRNNATYEVNVYVKSCEIEYRGTKTVYFLSRPMTDAERLEADLYTGRNK